MPWFCFQGWVQSAFRVGWGCTSQHSAFVAATCLQSCSSYVGASYVPHIWRSTRGGKKYIYYIVVCMQDNDCLFRTRFLSYFLPLICFIWKRKAASISRGAYKSKKVSQHSEYKSFAVLVSFAYFIYMQKPFLSVILDEKLVHSLL